MYVYSWNSGAGSWTMTQTLTGNHGEYFGTSISVDGTKALIGAPYGGKEVDSTDCLLIS